MNYTIKLNGVTLEATYGFTTTFRLDEKLDTASFLVPFSANKNAFPVNSTVEIDDGEKKTYWLVASDVVEPVSLNPELYSHSVDLVEYTKKLEYYFLPAATFTQPTDGSVRYNLFDVIDRLRKIVTIERLFSNPQYPYEIPAATQSALVNFKSPEMYFNNVTLLEALKQTLMYIGVLPRLSQDNGNDVLLLDFIAEPQDLRVWENLWIGYNASQDGSFYATKIISEADNAIATDLRDEGNYYPSEGGWAPLSTPDGIGLLTNSNAVMDVRKGIYDILELKVWAHIRYTFDNITIETNFVELDITDYVVLREVYEILPAIWPLGTPVKTQQNTIWYNQNDRYIQGLTTNWSTTFSASRRSLENVILTKFTEQNPGAFALTIQNDYYDLLFRAKFITIEEDRHIEVERSNVGVVNKVSKMFFRQNDRVVSLDSYVSRMKKTVDRVGEQSFNISLLHSDPSEVFKVGDFTTEDFRITVAELVYERDHIVGNYQFTKHFPNINKFIGVDRGLQPFELPTGFKVVNRPVSYKDYLIISTTPSNTNNSVVVSAGVSEILKTFDNNHSATEAQTGLITNPILGAGNLRVYAPTIINGFENAFAFNMGFKDNQLAGFRLELIDSGNITAGVVQLGVPYAPDGFMSSASFEIKAKRTNSLPGNFQDAQIEANELPYVFWHTAEPTYVEVTSANPLVVLKDPAEILNFNYQLNVFGASPQIIIGKYFTKYNKLIYDLDKPLYFYGFNKTFNAYENEQIDPTGGELLNASIISTLPYSIGINNVTTGFNSYAIATASGELLLAVNRVDGVLPTTLYFNFSHVRPGTEII